MTIASLTSASPAAFVRNEWIGNQAPAFDYEKATTEEIIARVTSDPIEQKKYLNYFDGRLAELSSGVDGETLSPAQLAERFERERLLGWQTYGVMKAFEASDPNFHGEISTRYDRLAKTPFRGFQNDNKQDPSTLVSDLARDREHHQSRFLSTLEFTHKLARGQLDAGTPTETGLAWIKRANASALHVLRNDPVVDASSQAFHDRVAQYLFEGEKLQTELDNALHHRQLRG